MLEHDLVWRSLTAADIEAWIDLVERYESDEHAHDRTRRSDLERLTRRPWVDLAADTLVAVDRDGAFRAVGHNGLRPGSVDAVAVSLNGGVDPHWRGKGLGRRILEWQRARAGQMIAEAREKDESLARLPGRMGGLVEEQAENRGRLFDAAGFTISRSFMELRRPLDGGVYDVPGPLADGLRVVRLDEDLGDRVRLANNEAFLDHWGTPPYGPEAWRSEVLGDEAYRPRQSFAIVDVTEPDEPVAAYVRNYEFEHDWEALGFTEGYTESIGVRRPWRGRGLAKYLLALTAQVFAEAGHPYATLDVDAENATGAVKLYAGLGYEAVHRSAYYSVAA